MIQLGTYNIKSSYITRDAWGTLQSSNILQGKKRRKFLQFHRAANGNEMKGTLAAYYFLMVDPILKYLEIRSLWTKWSHFENFFHANPQEFMSVIFFSKRRKIFLLWIKSLFLHEILNGQIIFERLSVFVLQKFLLHFIKVSFAQMSIRLVEFSDLFCRNETTTLLYVIMIYMKQFKQSNKCIRNDNSI